MPSFDIENNFDCAVCGIDEVGRGPLAGPVVSASVCIPYNIRTLDFIKEIQDSKKLSKFKLLRLHTLITQHCFVGIGQCSPAEIDEINILWASMRAMERAYSQMMQAFGENAPIMHALIDGNRTPKQLPCDSTAVVKGDCHSYSIAAASIIAKVTRDNIMSDLSENYPHYGWHTNAAYPTKQHLAAIDKHGITPHHRRSFGPVKKAIANG